MREDNYPLPVQMVRLGADRVTTAKDVPGPWQWRRTVPCPAALTEHDRFPVLPKTNAHAGRSARPIISYPVGWQNLPSHILDQLSEDGADIPAFACERTRGINATRRDPWNQRSLTRLNFTEVRPPDGEIGRGEKARRSREGAIWQGSRGEIRQNAKRGCRRPVVVTALAPPRLCEHPSFLTTKSGRSRPHASRTAARLVWPNRPKERVTGHSISAIMGRWVTDLPCRWALRTRGFTRFKMLPCGRHLCWMSAQGLIISISTWFSKARI
jgi:hypothetical protein